MFLNWGMKRVATGVSPFLQLVVGSGAIGWRGGVVSDARAAGKVPCHLIPGRSLVTFFWVILSCQGKSCGMGGRGNNALPFDPII